VQNLFFPAPAVCEKAERNNNFAFAAPNLGRWLSAGSQQLLMVEIALMDTHDMRESHAHP
jgi:hypothetical protein